MNLLAAAAIAAIATAGYLVVRSALFPAVVFGAAWAGALVLLELAGDAFYPIHDLARAVYTLGAAAFGVGAVAGWLLAAPPQRPERLDHRRIGWILDGFLVLLIVAAPLYWAELQRIAREVAVESVLMAARIRTVEGDTGVGPGIPRPIGNLIQLSIFFTYVAFAAGDGSKRWRARRLALAVASVTYQILTGGRHGAALIVIGATGISWMRSGRITLRWAAYATVAFLVTFSFVAIQLGKGDVRRDLDLRENLPALVADLQAYALSGVYAFDLVAQDPSDVPSTGGPGRAVRELLNRFGARYEIPGLHAQFRTLGDFREGNVYSAYFTYFPDLGLPGTAALLALLGAASGAAFAWARGGSLAGRVLYGVAFAAMCESVYTESFLATLNFLVKSGLLLGAIYAIATRWGHPPAGLTAPTRRSGAA